MIKPVHAALLLSLVSISSGAVLGQSSQEPLVSAPTVYTGICGASAAAPVNADLFVVADDEGNQLRLYRRDQGGPPLQVFDLTNNLQLDRRSRETDIEGGARIGDLVYWITSHSRTSKGKVHPNRHRFFATRLTADKGAVGIAMVGRPYTRLLEDLVTAPALAAFKLRNACSLPPKADGGFNIESLCASPNNELFIGFRNPIPGGKALLVPILNPNEIVLGKAARIGTPVLLDLGGLGIRDMAWRQGGYVIVAGKHDGGGKSRLFSWSGPGAQPQQVKDVKLKGLNPEAVLLYPDLGFDRIQLLSDDSSQGKIDCKDLPAAARRFRAVWVSLQ